MLFVGTSIIHPSTEGVFLLCNILDLLIYSLKLEKIAAEREKARRKRDEWEERRKEWDRKYHEQENSEICEMVHAQSLTPEQLAVIIQLAQAAVPNPENLKLDEKETEDME